MANALLKALLLTNHSIHFGNISDESLFNEAVGSAMGNGGTHCLEHTHSTADERLLCVFG